MAVKTNKQIKASDFNALYNRLAALQDQHLSFSTQNNSTNFDDDFLENPISNNSEITASSLQDLNDELILLKNSTWNSDVSYDSAHTAPTGYQISLGEQLPESIPHIADNPTDNDSITVGNLIKASQFKDIENVIDEAEKVKLSYSTQYLGQYTGQYTSRYDSQYTSFYSGGFYASQYTSFYASFYASRYDRRYGSDYGSRYGSRYGTFYTGFYGSRYGSQYRSRYGSRYRRYGGFYGSRYRRYTNRARSQ